MPYKNAEILRDKNGNPIPQYYNVATGQFEPLTGENGATHTQLTGSKVEYEEFFERRIRTANESVWNRRVPDGVTGLIYILRVFGVTGTFAQNEGVRLVFYQNTIGYTIRSSYYTHTNRIASGGTLQIVVMRGYDLKDASLENSTDCKIINSTPHSNISLQIDISGTFATQEGIDCSAYLVWFY